MSSVAPMAAELVDRVAILVAVRRFFGMGAADSRSLRSGIYVRMQHFVRRTTCVPFRRFLGNVRREFMQRLSTPLHGTLGSYLRDALLWHAFVFLGLSFFSSHSFLLFERLRASFFTVVMSQTLITARHPNLAADSEPSQGWPCSRQTSAHMASAPHPPCSHAPRPRRPLPHKT